MYKGKFLKVHFAQEQIDNARRRRARNRITAALICLVVLCTVFALTQPVLSMEYDCALEEHTHTDSCYEQITTVDAPAIDCTFESHVHTEDCGEDCGRADFTVHTHDAMCYDGERLICSLPEIAEHSHEAACYQIAHTHTEDCYDEAEALVCSEDTETQVLICEKEEICLHTHTDACFDEEQNRICGQVEVLAHQHDTDCLTTAALPVDTQALTCAEAESDTHTHGARCYGTWELTCQVPEHTHTDDCRSQAATETTEATEATETAEKMPEVGLFSYRPVEVVDGGTFASVEGNELTWTVTKDTLTGEYTLTIDGEGAMPNLGKTEKAPWDDYETTGVHLVFGENITRIGAYNFSSWYVRTIQWGGVAEIGESAFESVRCMLTDKTLDLPGTIKTLDNYVFYGSNYQKFLLHEGTESIASRVFATTTVATEPIYIPASVTYISSYAFIGEVNYHCMGYDVDPDNPTYCSVDGVLFSKDMQELVSYPASRPDAVYEVPEQVQRILYGAFERIQHTKKIILSADDEFASQYLFRGAKVEEIYIKDATPKADGTFGQNKLSLRYGLHGVGTLTSIRYPENTEFVMHYWAVDVNTTYGNLKSLKIPNGTKEIYSTDTSSEKYLNFPVLEEVLYDAIDADIKATERVIGNTPDFDLTIGEHVDHLPAAFTHIAIDSGDVFFAGDNSLTIDAGAFAGKPGVLSRMEGTYYTDQQGVVYACDETAGTAAVAYCPPGLTQITIPAAIGPGEGVSYPVTGVKQDALSLAEDLTAVTFADPAAITTLEPHALANCPTLTQVNGKTSVPEAVALFENATVGHQVLMNTALEGADTTDTFEADMSGQKQLILTEGVHTVLELTVADPDNAMEWTGSQQGGYRLLTGHNAMITASVDNTTGSENQKRRIYMRFTNDSCELSMKPGISETFNGCQVDYHPTEDPYTVYAEFTPPVGATVAIPFIGSYPSPTSRGGGLTVWGVVDDGTLPQDRVVESDDVIQFSWRTVADDFAVSKAPTATHILDVRNDDNGIARPSQDLAWTVQSFRQAETVSGYGKDYVKNIDFTDILTLPQGIVWDPQIQAAIESGSISVKSNDLWAGNRKIASMAKSSDSTGMVIHSRSVTWQDGKAVFGWGLMNNVPQAEINTGKVTVTIYKDVLRVDPDVYDPAQTVDFVNEVYATVQYTHRPDAAYTVHEANAEQAAWIENEQLYAKAVRQITGGAGKIGYAVTDTPVSFFGEDITYNHKVYNDGALPVVGDKLQEDRGYIVQNNMEQTLYIKPENIQRMLDEDESLTVTITGAVLGEKIPVTDVNGGTETWLHPGNSDAAAYECGHTLVLTKAGENQYAVTVDGGESKTGSSVAQLLDDLGYTVTKSAVYSCQWQLNEPGTPLVLANGQTLDHYTYATVKDTFKMTDVDFLKAYNASEAIPIKSTVVLLEPDGRRVTNSKSRQVMRDLDITKGAYNNGVYMFGDLTADDGDVLDYVISLSHYGSGNIQNMPLVDDLCGSQYLLVPASKNPGLTNLPRLGDHFILTEGTYENVVVGVDDTGEYLTAATITVTRESGEKVFQMEGNTYSFTGIHTQIKWYFPELSDGHYRMDVRYQAVVDTSVSGVEYDIGNLVTANDRTGSGEDLIGGRIYNVIWGRNILIDYDMAIVTEKGNTAASDVITEHSTVYAGQQVTYRLEVDPTNSHDLVINGQDLAVLLPDTFGLWQWEIGKNVTDIRFELGDGVTGTNMEDWYLDDQYIGLVTNQQIIRWPESAELHFREDSIAYIYYTLTYPEDEAIYSALTEIMAGSPFFTDYYAYSFSDSVSHDLAESGKVFLQKGVWGMYHYKDGSESTYQSSDSRFYFNNTDARKREVAYYVVLCNNGYKRLYLNDLYDILPEGFSFHKFITRGASVTASSSYLKEYETMHAGTGVLTGLSGADVKFVSATVTREGDGADLRFVISSPGGKNALKYDEKMGKYYLDRGEAIEFAYLCSIGSAAKTGDIATNTVLMPYTDHTGTGLTVIDKEQISLQTKLPENQADYSDTNDGSRLTKTQEQVEQEFGLSGQDLWLQSGVTLHRGSIVPGVTKYTGTPTEQKTSVVYTEEVPWCVRLHNAGNHSMTDFTMVDTLPIPYSFTGEISYTLSDGANYTSDPVRLMKIPEHPVQSGLTLELTDYQSGTTKRKVVIDGAEVLFGKGDTAYYVSISIHPNGNEVLTIRFAGVKHTVMEGGYMDVKLQSVNVTGNHTFSVFTNEAVLLPTQTFASVGHGSMIRDENGIPVGVKNTAPVTITSAYSTISKKHVEPDNDPSASTALTGEDFIILPDVADTFTYRLQVENDNALNMTNLVIIDSLPAVGDHSPFDTQVGRDSAFWVELAQDPNWKVEVQDPEGSTVTSQVTYKVEYSTGTDFGAPHSPHWLGMAVEDFWTEDPTDARSVRIIIEGTIAPKAVVEVSFRAKVQGDAQAGQTAWNNFGYHYVMDGQTIELEAMSPTVGVKIPSIPTLRKKLVDTGAQPAPAIQDSTFRFVVYEGAAITGNYKTAETFLAALETAGREYREISLDVAAGSTVSNQKEMEFADWSWRKGDTYTVAELPLDDRFDFGRFYGTRRDQYTFTYDPAQDQSIVCENICNIWALEVTKVDVENNPLSGAVFALYSAAEADQITLEGSIPRTVRYGDRDWYLTKVAVSGADGKLRMENLTRTEYYLMEVGLPDGYVTSTMMGRIVYREDAQNGETSLQVKNIPGVRLPLTGGVGTAVFYAAGSILTLAASVLATTNKKRRKNP